jgi:hypothetical protein
MNNKSAIEKNNHPSMLEQLRAIRDKISFEIMHLNKEQMKLYFERKKNSFTEEMRKRYSRK